MIEKSFDLPFYPYDDISYHQKEKDKNGVRCVVVVPNGFVETAYVDRHFGNIAELMRIKDKETCPLNSFSSEDIVYESNGVPKNMTVISVSYSNRQLCCIKYNGESLVYADACIITGENFTDLSMDMCYALVMSARAAPTDNAISVSVNISDNMDMIPRLISDEE